MTFSVHYFSLFPSFFEGFPASFSILVSFLPTTHVFFLAPRFYPLFFFSFNAVHPFHTCELIFPFFVSGVTRWLLMCYCTSFMCSLFPDHCFPLVGHSCLFPAIPMSLLVSGSPFLSLLDIVSPSLCGPVTALSRPLLIRLLSRFKCVQCPGCAPTMHFCHNVIRQLVPPFPTTSRDAPPSPSLPPFVV